MSVQHEFVRALWDGDTERAAVLRAAGASLNAVAPGGYWPPLHAAIENLQIECVDLLINAGVDVNCSMPNGLTPLMHAIDAESDSACQCNVHTDSMSLDIMLALLTAGAVVTPEAVGWAERSYGSARIMQLLAGGKQAESGPASDPEGV